MVWPPRVCVCVVLLYSYQLGGQGSPLSTTEYLLSSTQLNYNQLSVGTPSEKIKRKGKGKQEWVVLSLERERVVGVLHIAGRDWPELRGLQLTNGSYVILSGSMPRRCEIKVVRMGRVFVRRGRS